MGLNRKILLTRLAVVRGIVLTVVEPSRLHLEHYAVLFGI